MAHHDLDRFVTAQAAHYETALAEVNAASKRSHWMWFIFPQIAGLGRSDMARRYAIADLSEAKAYLAHPILGPRLRQITSALEALPVPDAERVFGDIDAVKLRSSLTLFAHADMEPGGLFRRTLDRWFDGQEDSATLERI